MGRTIARQILAEHGGEDARAADIVAAVDFHTCTYGGLADEVRAMGVEPVHRVGDAFAP